jgi:hypothetical protein
MELLQLSGSSYVHFNSQALLLIGFPRFALLVTSIFGVSFPRKWCWMLVVHSINL